MRNGQLDSVLRHVRSLVAAPQTRELRDLDLLQRFVADHDEATFAAIVERHGPLVLAVCRRILRNEHHAEDACQATFLVLARKADTIRKRESLGSWLHGVASRVARKLDADVKRRAAGDVTTADVARPDTTGEITWREGLAVLDEELARLPVTYRSALVLCYLQGKTQDEAARELGCSLGALRGRLERARECLRTRLVRRGVALPAALLGTVFLSTQGTAALPAALAVGTVKAVARLAGGQALARAVPATVATLTQGVLTAMSVKRVKMVAALVLTVGLLTAGAFALAAAARNPREPGRKAAPVAAQAGPKAKGGAAPADRESLTIRGRVLGPDGKPFAGAKLYLHDPNPGKAAPAVRATSGKDGRFQFPFTRRAGQVVAMAEGNGCDWASVGQAEARRELTLRLVKDVPIRGRVLDRDGKAVAGAKVRVVSVAAYAGEDLTKMLEDFRRVGWQTSRGVKQWNGPLPGQPATLTTGADGRFRLAGFGRERTVNLYVEGPAIEYTTITVMTRADKAVTGYKPPEGYRQSKLYPATFDYLAAPSRPIRGVVRDKATGKPMPGVLFWSYLTTHRPLTDGKGRYEILGHPKAPTYTLYLVPPDGRHFAIRVKVPDTGGLDPLTADIDLPSGITVKGRAIDKASGKPVAGVRVSYFVLYPNPKVSKLDGYHEYEGVSRAKTGPDGSYTLTVLPGPGVLTAEAEPASSYRPALVTPKEVEDFLGQKLPDWLYPSQDSLAIHGTGAVANARNMSISQSQYNALVLINPREKEPPLVRDLVLLPALTRQGTVVGPDGKPLSGVTAIGVDGPYSNEFNMTLKSSGFTVRGLHPKRARELFFHHKEKNLGRYLKLGGEQGEPLKVELQPCGSVAGRLVDKGGKPVAGTVIYVCRQGYVAFFPGGFQVKTDKDGRFRAEGLVPGQPYTLTRETANIVDTALPRGVVVEPGKKKDLGDLVVAPLPPR
jgi:RNA polymerase sigma factor (sigma-70 family)